MFGLFGRDYSKCPHFDRRHNDEPRFVALEIGHKEIVEQLKVMAVHDEEQNLYLKKHMEEEGIHHTKTNEAIAELVGVVKDLVKDKNGREIEEEVEDRLNKASKPQRDMWTKVKLTVISVVTASVLITLGTGGLFVYDLYKKFNGGE